jgi:hypothetical protein
MVNRRVRGEPLGARGENPSVEKGVVVPEASSDVEAVAYGEPRPASAPAADVPALLRFTGLDKSKDHMNRFVERTGTAGLVQLSALIDQLTA